MLNATPNSGTTLASQREGLLVPSLGVCGVLSSVEHGSGGSTFQPCNRTPGRRVT